VIAAVDCKRVFAPQFVKTQLFGFSPMDLGTGIFVAVKGLDTLRRDLRDTNVFQSKTPTTKPHQTYSGKRKSSKSNFFVPRFLPLLVIGLARAIFVLKTGYYQDPTEYGLHWNFFITLAIVEVEKYFLILTSFSVVYLCNSTYF
jgi:phosphatidylinositol glycan class W